jgi:neopullulanase
VGEVLDGDAEIVSYFAGGVAHLGVDTGLDTPFDYPLNFALRGVLADGKPMTELARILRQDELYPHPERLVTFLDNHDTMRFITTVHGSLPKYKLALGLLFTLRGTPQMYVGDEIAMVGDNDPDNRHDFPGGFPSDLRNAFLVSGRTPAEQETFVWTKELLALRKAHPELETGIEQNLLATDDVFVYARAFDAAGCGADHAQERILAIANKSGTAKTIEIVLGDTVLAGCTEFRSLAPTQTITFEGNKEKWKINVPAEGLFLVSVR